MVSDFSISTRSRFFLSIITSEKSNVILATNFLIGNINNIIVVLVLYPLPLGPVDRKEGLNSTHSEGRMLIRSAIFPGMTGTIFLVEKPYGML